MTALTKRKVNFKEPLSMQQVLVAVATYPDLKAAKAYMEEQGYMTTTSELEQWRRNKGDELEKIREEIAPRLEASLANDMLDVARMAVEAQRIAIERTQERLEKNQVMDPSTVARNLSQLMAQNVEKRLSLQGRPTQITETRNLDEMIRKLESMGVAKTYEVEAVAEDITDG